jgi:hypothetical protein
MPKNVLDKLLALEDEVNQDSLARPELRAVAHGIAHLRASVAEVARRKAHDELPLTPAKQAAADQDAARDAAAAKRHAAAKAEQTARENEAGAAVSPAGTRCCPSEHGSVAPRDRRRRGIEREGRCQPLFRHRAGVQPWMGRSSIPAVCGVRFKR